MLTTLLFLNHEVTIHLQFYPPFSFFHKPLNYLESLKNPTDLG